VEFYALALRVEAADAFLLTMMRDGTPLPPQRGSTHELTYAEYRSLTEAYS
jgi:hypothetical protein